MNYFFLDASAYAKYYYPEPGTDIVEALVHALPDIQARRLVVTAEISWAQTSWGSLNLLR